MSETKQIIYRTKEGSLISKSNEDFEKEQNLTEKEQDILHYMDLEKSLHQMGSEELLKTYYKKYFEFFHSLIFEILDQEQKLREKLEKEADRIVEPQYADCAGSNISWNEYILPPEEGERIEEEVEEKLSNYLAKFTAEDFRELIFDEFNI